MICRDVVPRLEEEAPARLLLDLAEPRAAGSDEQRRNVRVELDPERLVARLARQRAQPPLGVDGERLVGNDDAVPRAGRAGDREDLARTVGHVLARHLDEPERRDLDHVRLRPIALELAAERVLDRLAVLRVRHVDEVDDDDPADVAEPELANDLLDGLEVVLRDRVLEPRPRGLPARPDEAAGVDVDDREGFGVVEDQVAARRAGRPGG